MIQSTHEPSKLGVPPIQGQFRSSVCSVKAIGWMCLLFILLTNMKVDAANAFTMKYRFLSDTTGGVIISTYLFDGGSDGSFLLYSSGETCPGDEWDPLSIPHKDPNGQNYEHGHTYEAFDFIVNVGGTAEIVTVEKSNEAWDMHYTGFSRDSDSSFLANCYAVAASAPTPMNISGWEAWTTSATFCHNNSIGHSYYKDPDHVVVYGVFIHYAGCELQSTQEKNASGPKYSMTYVQPNWGPWPTGQKRKRI